MVYSPAGGFLLNYKATGGTFGRGIFLLTGAGADTVYVQGTLAGGVTFVLTGGGDDTIAVTSAANTLDGFAGLLVLDAGAGANLLFVSEAGRAVGDMIGVASTSIASTGTGFAMTYISTGGTFGRGVTVQGTAGDDLIVVLSQAPAAPTVVLAAGGNDTVVVDVSTTSFYAMLTIDGGAGSNLLDVEDVSGGAVVHNFPTGPGSGVVQVTYLGDAVSLVNYVNFGTVTSNVSPQQSYIQALFHQILGRIGSPAEINAFVALLNSQGRLAVVTTLEHLPEARTHLVDGWFVRFLGAPPLPGADAPLVNMLLAGSDEEDVLGLLLGNLEVTRTAAFRTQEVILDYQRLLHRLPTPVELNGWVQSSLTLQDIREILEASDEFFLVGT
jgi:hypothetical protein